MNIEYKGIKIPELTSFDNCTLQDCDFTKTDLTHVIFKNVNFDNCVFAKTTLNNTRFYSCFFYKCTFNHVNFTGTNIGSWGGGIENCLFSVCRLAKITTVSYLINTIFDNCKIKDINIRALYLFKVKFVGYLDGLRFQRFDTEDIVKYQDAEYISSVTERIKNKVGVSYSNPKVFVKDIDLLEAKMKFLNLSETDIQGIKAPSDPHFLYIGNNLLSIVQNVTQDIEQNWDDENSKSWALYCTKAAGKGEHTIISYDEFKHFENDAFAEKLMSLFYKYIN